VLRLRRLLWGLAVGGLALGPTAAAAPVPTPDATAYILVNPASGEVLAARAPDRALPMASTTKIMTALVAMERARPDQLATVPPEATAVGESSAGLVDGERLSVAHLLAATLVGSGNDAAVTLADFVGGSQAAFVRLMNRRAAQLGLRHTHFANAYGLDQAGHHASPRDLVTLARAAMRYARFRRLVAGRTALIPGPFGEGVRRLESKNDLLDIDPDADGVKTGETDGAGYALVAHARRPGLGVELYAAMIGEPTEAARARDARRLLDWGFRQYARPTLVAAGQAFGSAPVRDRPGVRVVVRARAPLRAPVRLGQPLRAMVVLPAELRAPIGAGQTVGSVVVREGGRVVGRRDLVAAASVRAPSLVDRLRAGWDRLLP
jgi:D-alanyl-D-alanine carboxypeptidase (penicillin-binding protein 5/6)